MLAAAKKCFVQINSYDYRDLDGLVAKDTACTTGTFTGDLRKALQTPILKLAPTLHARQTAQVNKAGIASISPDGKQVVTLIYGQFSVTNDQTAKKQPRVDVVGAVVTVTDVQGTWRIVQGRRRRPRRLSRGRAVQGVAGPGQARGQARGRPGQARGRRACPGPSARRATRRRPETLDAAAQARHALPSTPVR